MGKGGENVRANKPRLQLLASLDSFEMDEKGRSPSYYSMLVTVAWFVGVLVLIEQTLRQVLASIQDLHPLFQEEINRHIMARHVGVDAVSCFTVAYLGWKARTMIAREFHTRVPDNRMYQYDPQAARILLYFFAFQAKNLCDSWVWNDGPEFLAHHLLAMYSAAGGLAPYPTFAFYGVFYMGMSELSTGVLCLLVNFDDQHGVAGLGDAFPIPKALLGGLFAILFVLIRVVAWSIFTHKYFRDVFWTANPKDPNFACRKVYIYSNSLSLGLISLLQVVWLFEILRVSVIEIRKLL